MVPNWSGPTSSSNGGTSSGVPRVVDTSQEQQSVEQVQLRTEPMSDGTTQQEQLPQQETSTANPHVPIFDINTVIFDSNTDKLGEGSFGLCYKVRHLVLGKCVLKIPQQNHLQLGNTKNALFLQRREFMHCVMLNHHHNIVSFYGYVHKSGRPEEPEGFLMEYMQGGNLFQYLKNDFALPSEVLNGWAKQIAQGLSFMHHRGIIHRDLNPNNILLSRDLYVAKISDFGLAKKVEAADSTWKHTVKVGTAIYRAPEVFVDNKYHYPVDVYSYGMTLYFIYYRRLPFEGEFFRKMSAYKVQQKLTGGEGELPLRPKLGLLVDERGSNRLSFQDKLIEMCWDSDPAQRPTIFRVVELFEWNKEALPTTDV